MVANLTNSPCRLCDVVTPWRLCCYRPKLCNGIPQGRLLPHANISFFSLFAVLSKLLQTNGKPQLALFRPKFLISTPFILFHLVSYNSNNLRLINIYIYFYCFEYLYQYVKAFSDRSWYKKYNSQTHRLLL